MLIVSVFVRHFTAHSIGSQTYLNPRGWFYVMGGLWEALLCAVIGLMFWQTKDRVAKVVGLLAMAIGIVEAIQMVIARSLVYDMKTIPINKNVLDHLSGLQLSAVLVTLYLFIFGWLIYKNRKQKS